ncbi:imm11 family protein [Shimia sp. MIT1388]|uniref:imm11 family protein n=1 Tax=Shimia sp. MIT1388 TaxID=3096992 RepID=UPI00399A7648
MAVFLAGDSNIFTLSGWYNLEVLDPDGTARIQAGQAYLEQARKTWMIETRGREGLINFGKFEKPWRAEFLPEKLIFKEGVALPDWVQSFPGCNTKYAKFPLLSQSLKALIDAHKGPMDSWQFFPIDILNKDATPYATYYAWCIGRVRDAVDETCEGVKPIGGPVDGQHVWNTVGLPVPERLILKKKAIEGLNAWTDFRLFASKKVFVSDVLFEAMTVSGAKGFVPDSVWSEK